MEPSSEEIYLVQKSPDRIYIMFFNVLLHLQSLQIYIQVVPGSQCCKLCPNGPLSYTTKDRCSAGPRFHDLGNIVQKRLLSAQQVPSAPHHASARDISRKPSVLMPPYILQILPVPESDNKQKDNASKNPGCPSALHFQILASTAPADEIFIADEVSHFHWALLPWSLHSCGLFRFPWVSTDGSND